MTEDKQGNDGDTSVEGEWERDGLCPRIGWLSIGIELRHRHQCQGNIRQGIFKTPRMTAID